MPTEQLAEDRVASSCRFLLFDFLFARWLEMTHEQTEGRVEINQQSMGVGCEYRRLWGKKNIPAIDSCDISVGLTVLSTNITRSKTPSWRIYIFVAPPFMTYS